MDAATLANAMGNTLSFARYEQLTPAFNSALQQADCTTVNRAAMFAAQIGHESVGLKYGEEIASGSAYEWRSDLGNTYAGDGMRYKGHGWIQVTGRGNHTAVSQWSYSKGYVPSPTYFVDNPTELASDQYVWIGPVWYWTVARNMNGYADDGDIVGATRAVNGGLNGLADRTNRWNHCLSLGAALLPEEDDVRLDESVGQRPDGTDISVADALANAYLATSVDGPWGKSIGNAVRSMDNDFGKVWDGYGLTTGDVLLRLAWLFPPIDHDAITERGGHSAGDLTNASHSAWEQLVWTTAPRVDELATKVEGLEDKLDAVLTELRGRAS